MNLDKGAGRFASMRNDSSFTKGTDHLKSLTASILRKSQLASRAVPANPCDR